MRFLVTGANGDIGDAAGRILRESFAGSTVVGADAGAEWPALDTFPTVHSLPFADDPTYSRALVDLVEREQLDLVVPCSEPELSRLALDPGPAVSVDVLTIAPALVSTFLDKLAAAAWFSAHAVPTPATTALESATAADLPLVVKPRRGAGGRGVVVVRTEARLRVEQAERDEPCIAQSLLSDDCELTCAVVRIGGVTRSLQLRRTLQSGVTVGAVVEHRHPVEELLVDLAEAAGLEGCLNVQLRIEADGPKVFEVNPRLSSSVKLRHHLGFEDLRWWVLGRQGQPLPAFVPPVGAQVFRLSREVVVPP